MTNNNSVVTPLIVVSLIVAAVASGFLIGKAEKQTAIVANRLDLYPNIETMGVAASGAGLPGTAELKYRQSGEAAWHTGHPLVRIPDGRLIGSLFWLSPATTYEVKVVAGSVEFGGIATTQPDELQFTPAAVLHVDDNASAGGDGSAAAPFQTIQEAVNRAGPGTQILVADGIYREAVTFPASGTAGQWIQVKAQGSGAILDGSDERTGKIWTAHPTKGRVWFMKLAAPISYLARDQKRFYNYDDLNGLLQSRGHGKVTINEGWYYDANASRLYLRSQDDPSRHTWQIPRLSHAFDIDSRDWLWIEGFEIRFYGARNSGCGVCAQNASHLVVRKNKIHNLQLGIFPYWTGGDDRGNDTRIEYNEVYDPAVNEFPWLATKGSSMEGTGIIIRGHIGAIVRNNEVHNFFNGIYTGSSAANAIEDPALAFDADIYNNYIHHISDDGLEPEGAAVNQRFRDNRIDRMLIGVSLAPITQGPTWVLRSTFTNFTSSPIKWASNPNGIIFFYHNTSWTNATNLNGMSMITPIHNVVMRNNIFQGTRYAFEEVVTGSTGNDWNNDNWYTTRAATLPHFKWENIDYNTLAQLCAATHLECNGYEDAPGLADPGGGDFTLLPSSRNIDRGIVIPGLNDNFKGNAPDIGAYEYELASDPPPVVLSSVRAGPNPTNAASVNFTVTFSEAVNGVDSSDFKATTSQGITGAAVTSATSVSGTTYTVSVNTGSGNGTLRLDVIDNDSIVDISGQPLAGAGNGSFTTGEEYTINKSVTTVSLSFKSNGAYDGWVLESGENTGVGGTLDRNATTFNVGDDQKDKQYKGVLSFDTGALPDNAVIVSVQLKVKKQDVVGTDPFGTHGALSAEIRNGPFGNSALETGDFSAAASPGSVKDAFATLTSSWYATQLSNGNLVLINKAGVTQFRLSFSKDDNDDLSADYVKFFSGNSTDANKPELLVTYYIP